MTILYSASTGGFYDTTIHASMPVDAVELSAEQHRSLLDGQSAGKRIVADEAGRPALQDPPPPSAAEIWSRIKTERDRRTEHGGYAAAGKWFHSDQKSRSQQLGLVLLGANIPAGLQWKTMDGSFVEMTQQLAGQILAAAAASDHAIFAAAEEHREAMERSADPASYDYSTGWPQTFDEAQG